MNLTYQDEKVGIIRYAVLSDCPAIGENMRAQDKLEIWGYDRSFPTEAVIKSLSKSIIAMTIEHDRKPIAMFGIMPKNMSSGTLWMFTTPGLEESNFGRPFVRNCKKWFSDMLEIYPTLHGCVDLRNEESIKWLTYLGATWGTTEDKGVDKMPFRRFSFSKHTPVVSRETIVDLEKKISDLPNVKQGDYLPLKHSFAEGMYVRELFVPKGELIVGKIHKKSNPVFILSGDISILSEKGIKRFKAPCYLISEPGAKRIGYAHEDTTWVEVFASHETDLVKLEAELIAKDFIEYDQEVKKFVKEVTQCHS